MNETMKMIDPNSGTQFTTSYNGVRITTTFYTDINAWRASVMLDGRATFIAEDSSFAEALQQAKDWVDEKRG